MCLPGFIEYIFYGFSAQESGFYDLKSADEKGSGAGEDTAMGGDDDDDEEEEQSYENEVFGVDPKTGMQFQRERRRKPMRYHGIIGSIKPEQQK